MSDVGDLFELIAKSKIRVKFWSCPHCVDSFIEWEGDVATCKTCGKTNKNKDEADK